MKNAMKFAAAAALALGMLGTAVHAETAQQSKMKTCNADAKTKALAGDERRKFMSSCLSASATPAGNSQQNRMKTCNADAKSKALAGEERKKFMSACLSGA